MLEQVFRVISLRYFNPIGAHPSGMIGEIPLGTPNNLVPYITQTAAGIREKLTVFGNDYDTPDGIVCERFYSCRGFGIGACQSMQYLARKTEKKLYEVFNLGTGVGVSVLQLIEKFIAVTNVKFRMSLEPEGQAMLKKFLPIQQKSTSY